MFTEHMPALVNGFVAPTANVATLQMSANVVRGVSRARNALINGDYVTYDWDSGYTCHQLGSGEILIQLGQPYWLSTMRILLWDIDERLYSFYVETSTNQRTWDMAVDMRNERLRSWQPLAFNARAVVFIKIVGTYNTANEVGALSHSFAVVCKLNCVLFRCQIFHCVHFECPSQVEVPVVVPAPAPAIAVDDVDIKDM